MTLNKRSKNSRQRGSTSHGWGSMKKHRGAGNRGGRGNAGSGKRGDQKKPSGWKKGRRFGRFGFKSKSRTPTINVMNIKTLEDRFQTLLKSGIVIQKGELVEVNLSDIGCNKLLSNGNVTKKFKITTDYATEKAIEKIKQAGGEVILPSKTPKKSAEDSSKKE